MTYSPNMYVFYINWSVVLLRNYFPRDQVRFQLTGWLTDFEFSLNHEKYIWFYRVFLSRRRFELVDHGHSQSAVKK